MEDLESEFTIGYDELDCNVYEVLEGDSFDVWTPSTNQGWIDRRARVVKRRGRTVKQNIPYDIDNEFIVSHIFKPFYEQFFPLLIRNASSRA